MKETFVHFFTSDSTRPCIAHLLPQQRKLFMSVYLFVHRSINVCLKPTCQGLRALIIVSSDPPQLSTMMQILVQQAITS